MLMCKISADPAIALLDRISKPTVRHGPKFRERIESQPKSRVLFPKIKKAKSTRVPRSAGVPHRRGGWRRSAFPSAFLRAAWRGAGLCWLFALPAHGPYARGGGQTITFEPPLSADSHESTSSPANVTASSAAIRGPKHLPFYMGSITRFAARLFAFQWRLLRDFGMLLLPRGETGLAVSEKSCLQVKLENALDTACAPARQIPAYGGCGRASSSITC